MPSDCLLVSNISKVIALPIPAILFTLTTKGNYRYTALHTIFPAKVKKLCSKHSAASTRKAKQIIVFVSWRWTGELYRRYILNKKKNMSKVIVTNS